MKGIQKRLGSLLMAAVMLLSLAVTPAMAAEEKEPPTAMTVSSKSGSDFVLEFGYKQSDWAGKITGVQVNGESWTRVNYSFYIDSNKNYYVASSDAYVYIGEGFSGDEATCVISATGYNDLTLKLNKTNHTAEVVENSGSNSGSSGGSGSTEKPDTPENGTIAISDVTIAKDNWNSNWVVSFSKADGYVSQIQTVKVNGTEWKSTSYGPYSGGSYKKNTDENTLAFAQNDNLVNPEIPVLKSGDVITIMATGYKDLTFKFVLDDNGNASAEAVGGSGGGETPEQPDTPGKKTINVSDVKFESSSSELDWYVTFGTESDKYIDAIKGVSVNGNAWTSRSTPPYTGGSYCKYNHSNYTNHTETLVLAFAQKNYSSDSGTDVLKSGDIITITAEGYNDLMFKLVIDKNGDATVSEDTTLGDIYQLHVKIVGSFEAAIVGQKNYDGVSSASVGGASSNKNSAVTVYGALVEKGTDPTDKDWEKLNNESEIRLVGSKCSVSIVPDTSVAGMTADKDSGMKGVYMTLSSDLTLNGTPKDAGSYLVSVRIEDNQGRTATSNALPFRIYTGEETLADQLKTENLKKYESSGLYAWDIMEPWAIKNFGSNVTGEENSVRVPKDLEVWYGSHQSGTYGYLGYDQEWEKVEAGEIPQTLYIPNGCNLTLVNMEILSSVRIVVENGGKLTLQDSVVQGIIDVKSGGTFSMNYDSYEGKFLTGASICGQICLEDGAVLENAAIYSHTNYLANGNLKDRSNDKAVVAAKGNVTVKGQVFIQGDEAGSTGKGQTALEVKNGTLTLADNAVLVTYGGGGNVTLYSNGGSAVELDNGQHCRQGKTGCYRRSGAVWLRG